MKPGMAVGPWKKFSKRQSSGGGGFAVVKQVSEYFCENQKQKGVGSKCDFFIFFTRVIFIPTASKGICPQKFIRVYPSPLQKKKKHPFLSPLLFQIFYVTPLFFYTSKIEFQIF